MSNATILPPSSLSSSTAPLHVSQLGSGFCPNQEPQFLLFCIQMTYNYYDSFISIARAIIPEQQAVTGQDIYGRTVTRYENIPSNLTINNIANCLNATVINEQMNAFLHAAAPNWFSNGTTSFSCKYTQHSPALHANAAFVLDGLSQTGCEKALSNITSLAQRCLKTEEAAQSQALWSLLVLLLVLWPTFALGYAVYEQCRNGGEKNCWTAFKQGLFLPCEAVANCCSTALSRRSVTPY